MSRLYTTKMVDTIEAAGTASILTVPAGYLYVVRNIAVDVSATASTVGVIYEAGGATIWRWYVGVGDVYRQVEGRWALTAGTVLDWSGAYQTTIHMTGYALTLP